jgi:TatA/E family protein of Tat protein translocase
MGFSIWHLLIFALAALLVFGGSGRISSLMGDVAKGIKSFRIGLSEDDEGSPGLLKSIDDTSHKSITSGASPQDHMSTQGSPLSNSPCAERDGATASCTSHV